MGEVWKARDTRLDRTVAIKTSKERFTERFEREARAIAALNHPHICTLYDDGPDYLVMEYVEGEPLKGPLPLPVALKYRAQICEALEAAHMKESASVKPVAAGARGTGMASILFSPAIAGRAGCFGCITAN